MPRKIFVELERRVLETKTVVVEVPDDFDGSLDADDLCLTVDDAGLDWCLPDDDEPIMQRATILADIPDDLLEVDIVLTRDDSD